MEYTINQSIVYSVATPNVSRANINELHTLSNQISSGYLNIIRHHILPHIPHKAAVRIRELRILEYIFAANDEVVAHEISESTGYDAATVSRAISRLVRLGMVEKKASFTDKRTKLIKLKKKGKKLAKLFAKTESRVHESIIDRADLKVTAEEYEQFLRVSKKLLSRNETIEHTCAVLDKEFCKNCLQSRQIPCRDWQTSTAKCWPCDKYNFSKNTG